MKSIFKFSALALLATALMASCAKDIKETDMPVEGKKITKTFTLTFAQPDTKVAVTDAGKTTWEVGDEIYIHGKATEESQIVALTADNISADGKQAVIEVDVTNMTPYDPDGYYAAFPADAVGYSGDRTYYYGEFKNTNRPLMAAYQEGDTFKFFNLCGVITFTVNGGFDSFVFSGNAGEAVGYTFYQVKVNSEEQNFKRTMNGPLKEVEGELVPDGTTLNYVYFPNGVKLTNGFSIKFKDGVEAVKIAKTEKAVEIPRNGILSLGDITAKLEDYEEPEQPEEPEDPNPSEHKSEIPLDGAVDLSGITPANCYILEAPGTYKFFAFKGNSADLVGNVYGAEIVWESCNNAEDVAANSVIAAVDFQDNWIVFKTPDALKPGNAVIAAQNSKGNIIWSWHIWIPATPIAKDTYGLFNAELMDRNLGALVAAKVGEPAPVESFGLTYQWGRKDPFVGPAATSGGDNAKFAGTALSAAAGQITLAESIANPTVMGHVNNGDWLNEPDNTLWQNDEKTIYDPCPAGWKVPARDKTQPLMSEKITDVEGWEVNADNMYILVGNPAAVFPVCGYRDDYGVEEYAKIGSRVAYWTSYASNDAKGYHLNWRINDSYTLGETAKARGAYVRCVKTEEGVVPEPPQPQEPNTDPGPTAITIDGDLSDWANVEGITSEDGPYFAFKVAYDAENIYFYSKRNFRSDYWGDYGYFYFGMDEDNDESTAMSDPQGMPGADEWVLIYPFGGTNDAPAIPNTPGNGGLNNWDKYDFPANSLAGAIGTQFVEIEFACPRSILNIQPDAVVKFYSFGNKSASNIKTEGITLKIQGAAPVASVVVFEDDFEWVEPWATASKAGDAVKDNNPSTTAPNVFTATTCEGFMEAFGEKGYTYYWAKKGDTEWSDSLGEDNPKVLYLQANYLKFGKTDVSAAIKLPALAALTDKTDVELSFDWCWQVTGGFKPDLMTLVIKVDGDGTPAVSEFTSAQSTVEGESKIEWQHASVTINGASANTRIFLAPANPDPRISNPDRGQNRWYLDNIKIVTK